MESGFQSSVVLDRQLCLCFERRFKNSSEYAADIGENKAADGSKAGVAIIDVGDPRSPMPLGVLRDPGAINSVETMHAVAAPDRKVLVAGAYAGGKPGAALTTRTGLISTMHRTAGTRS